MIDLDELERLRKAHLQHGLPWDKALANDMQWYSFITEAAPELIAMARRYQWLRSCRGDSFYSCHEKDGYGGQVLMYGVDLDAAIDAAMEQKP
jgi:hypothetical protein